MKPNIKGQYSEISPHDMSNSKVVDEKFTDEIYDFNIDINAKKRSMTYAKKNINILEENDDESYPYNQNLTRTNYKNEKVNSLKKDKTV